MCINKSKEKKEIIFGEVGDGRWAGEVLRRGLVVLLGLKAKGLKGKESRNKVKAKVRKVKE